MFNRKISRRKLLSYSAKATLIGSMLLSNPLKLFSGILKDSSKSRVILIRDKRVLSSNGNFDKAVIEEMLDKALLRLTGAANIAAAWRQVLKPNDVLGIKSNVWSHLATPSELEQTLKEKAMGIGIKSNDISINDRGIRTDKVFQRASALINVRPARTHHWSGVGTLIKNYIMFDAKPWKWHGDSCADLAKLWKEYGVDKKNPPQYLSHDDSLIPWGRTTPL
jgi:hypothetical protein